MQNFAKETPVKSQTLPNDSSNSCRLFDQTKSGNPLVTLQLVLSLHPEEKQKNKNEKVMLRDKSLESKEFWFHIFIMPLSAVKTFF